MTDTFSIDFEVEGFRRNNLDWRKFRDNYTRVSASKVERGIKPLPLSLLLKLFGPQKVLNTYVVTRRATSDLDYLSTVADHLTAARQMHTDMQTNEKEKAVAKTLTFPGDGFFAQSEDNVNNKLQGKKSRIHVTKKDALPSRPAFQRSIHVPGRYFPKTSLWNEENTSHSVDVTRDRPRTRTPRSYIIQTPTSIPPDSRPGTKSQQSGFFNRGNSRVAKGPACKATETYSANSKRAASYSGKSIATVRSMPSFSSSDFLKNGRPDMLYVNSRNSDRTDCWVGNVPAESTNGDSHVEHFNTKRLRLSSRQVSFPGKNNVGFRTILQGRPKTLHRREYNDSETSLNHVREPRAKTHVGFVE